MATERLNFSLVCGYPSNHWIFTSQSCYDNWTVNVICWVDSTSSTSHGKISKNHGLMLLQVNARHCSMPPKRDCHLREVNLLSFVLRTALQSLEVDDGDISNPTDTGYVFALIFRNDFKQAECCDPITEHFGSSRHLSWGWSWWA